MPFTFSHPAIIVPLSRSKKLPLSFTGLIAGSMVPDFEFFLRMKVSENISHHWLGIFLFDLPLGVILCFLFHNTVRNLLFENLPLYYSVHLENFKGFNWNIYIHRNRFKVLISVFIGTLTHIFWDAFTHVDGYFTERMPLLAENAFLLGLKVPVYLILQIGSSVWGLWVVHSFIKKLPVKEVVEKKAGTSGSYWLLTGFAGCILLLGRFAFSPNDMSFMNLVMSCIGSVLWGIVIVSFYKNNRYLISRNNSRSNKFV